MHMCTYIYIHICCSTDWLILIYLEDSDIKKGKIIVENKANPEKHETKTFDTKEIFTYSDYLVDSMTAHIDRERQKKLSSQKDHLLTLILKFISLLPKII